jgi:hypothetical protein
MFIGNKVLNMALGLLMCLGHMAIVMGFEFTKDSKVKSDGHPLDS